MRTRVIAIAGATAGLLVAGVLVDGQIASAGTAHTLRATETFTRTQAVDVGAHGPSIGDHLAYTTSLVDLAGAKLGIGLGDCTRLTGSTDTTGLFHCSETVHLSGGDLVAGGLYSPSEKISHWTLFGGTGRYRGVRGQVDFTTTNGDTFHPTFRFDS